MIGGDYVIGESSREPLDSNQQLERHGILRGLKLTRIKFWNDVVNIQDDFGPGKFWIDRGENFEVRDGVDMDEVVTILELFSGQEGHRNKKEKHQFGEICELILLADGSALDSEYSNAADHAGRRLPLLP